MTATPNARAARRFLDALTTLTTEQLATIIARWRAQVGRTWHDADAALGHAIAEAGAAAEYGALLDRLYDIIRDAAWFARREPGVRIHASDATVEFLARSAMAALLVRDWLTEQCFAVLYAPFEQAIPLASLGQG